MSRTAGLLPQPIPGESRACDNSQAGLQVLHGAVDISFQNSLTIARLFPDKNSIFSDQYEMSHIKSHHLYIWRETAGAFHYSKYSGNFCSKSNGKFVSIRSDWNIRDHFCRRFSVIGRTEICRSLPIRIILVFLV